MTTTKKPHPSEFDKRWVVLKWTNGATTILPDYGDYAWGSARYDVLGYAKTRDEARALIKAEKEQEAERERMYGDPECKPTMSDERLKVIVDALKADPGADLAALLAATEPKPTEER
jgi:hypothetical protein